MEILIGYGVSFILGITGSIIATELLKKNSQNKKNKLLEKWEANISEVHAIQDDREYYQFGPIQIPIIPWLSISESNYKGWLEKDCSFIYNSSYHKVATPELETLIDNNWTTELGFNKRLVNEPGVGLLKLSLESKESKIYPKFYLYPTNFKNFIGTNKSRHRFQNADLNEYHNIEIETPLGYEHLNKSAFSNDLGTATTIITKDRKILLSKRTNKVHILPGYIHTSIAEGMNPERDFVIDSPSPFETIVKGAKEELDINIDKKFIRLLAIGIYLPFSQPYIACQIELNKTLNELIEESESNLNSWEGNILACNFTIEDLIPFLISDFESSGIKVAELAKHSILLSLAREFGFKELITKINYYQRQMN